MIIGIGHKSRVGKDTLAKFIISHIRQNTKNAHIAKLSFASKLKEICYLLYKQHGLEEEGYYNTPAGEKLRLTPLPKINKSPVQIWIEVGNYLREVYPYTWIDPVVNFPTEIKVVPDVRFYNEVEGIRNAGGINIRLTNPRAPILNSTSDMALDMFNEWDEEFNNAGDFQALNDFAIYICNKYILHRLHVEEDISIREEIK